MSIQVMLLSSLRVICGHRIDHFPSSHDDMEFRHIVERLFINCLTKDATSRQFYIMYLAFPLTGMRSTPSSRDLAIPGGFVATIARFRFNKGELIMKKALDFL